MVLPLKRWKSRTPPGIVAGGLCKGYNPFTMLKGHSSRRRPFFASLALICQDAPAVSLRTSRSFEIGDADQNQVYRGVEQPGSSSGS
jgi:hypothetical protein